MEKHDSYTSQAGKGVAGCLKNKRSIYIASSFANEEAVRLKILHKFSVIIESVYDMVK